MHMGRGHRLLYDKLSRHIVPTSRPADGLEVHQLLFLPSYRSFHPTPSQAAAQPHRAHSPHVYALTTHATKTLPTLPAQLATERRPITPVYGRLIFFCRQHRRAPTAPRPRRVPTRPPRARTQPQERPQGPYTNMRAPRPPDRHYNLYLRSPYFKTTRHCNPLPDPTKTLCTRRPMVASPTTRNTRWESIIPLPCHPGGSLLAPLTARRPRYTSGMVRTGKTHLSSETRPPMVDASPLRQQRPLHLLLNRDRLNSLR
jgi:hypothetical protein